jgi:predicted branched-subunit amino acid permease
MKHFLIRSPAFRQGFKAVLPLWLAAAPFALAYVIAAQKAGLNPLEIQIMSLTVYSAATQIAATQVLSGDIPILVMLISVVVMNVHHILYGVSLSKSLTLSRLQRVIGAYVLTDSTYAMTVAADNHLNIDFLFGAELSLFIAWNLFTAVGLLVGGLLVLPPWMPLDFIVPLTFFVLLVSSTKSWLDVAVVLISALLALGCLSIQLGGLTLLVVGIGGALVGGWIAQHQSVTPLIRQDQA